MRQRREKFEVSNMERVCSLQHVVQPSLQRPFSCCTRRRWALGCARITATSVGCIFWRNQRGASVEHVGPRRDASSAGSSWMVEFPVVLTLGVWKWRVTNFVMFLKLFPFLAILSTKQIFWPCACVKFTFHYFYHLNRESDFLSLMMKH